MAVTSTGTRSVAKRTSAPATTAKTNAIAGVIGGSVTAEEGAGEDKNVTLAGRSRSRSLIPSRSCYSSH